MDNRLRICGFKIEAEWIPENREPQLAPSSVPLNDDF
jgi:hypothetical protein